MTRLKEIYDMYNVSNNGDATILLLDEILETLKEMKQQEKEYWDTWKEAKHYEQRKAVKAEIGLD